MNLANYFAWQETLSNLFSLYIRDIGAVGDGTDMNWLGRQGIALALRSSADVLRTMDLPVVMTFLISRALVGFFDLIFVPSLSFLLLFLVLFLLSLILVCILISVYVLNLFFFLFNLVMYLFLILIYFIQTYSSTHVFL